MLLDGIGAADTFLVGVFYDKPTSIAQYLKVALIVSGVVILQLAY